MIPSGKRYSRISPPVFLSPIYESEEESQHVTVKSDSYLAEVNNSSVIPKQTSATTCGTDGIPCVSEDEEPSTKVERVDIEPCSGLEEEEPSTNVERVDIETCSGLEKDGEPSTKVGKVVIESCSGRKLEDVEVLKQKYINSEIQDLPRFLAESVGHNQIWKTRRNNLNFGSQDIRHQLSRLNLKQGASADHIERYVDYRCKRYICPRESSQEINKSAEELLHGDFCNTDDSDPELAALFENYTEECDNVTTKHYSEYPIVCNSEDENILSKYQMDPNSEHAFLCGFIVGMRQISSLSGSPEDATDEQGSDQIDNAAKCIASYRELISSKQDITHMSLREWENVHRLDQDKRAQRRQRLRKANITYQTKSSRRARNNDDNITVVTSLEASSKDDAGDFCKNPAAFINGIHALKSMMRREHTVNKNNKKNETETEVAHEEMLDEENKTVKAARRSFLKDYIPCRFNSKHLNANFDRENLTPSMREKSVNENKYRVVDIKNLSEEDEEIVKLARKKLEHSVFTSHALEDPYVSMEKTGMIMNDCKPEGVRKLINDSRGKKSNISKALTKDLFIPYDLDGWTTEYKAFSDHEGVQVSSSEILHPVDSFEKFDSPLWTPTSINSPRIPSVDTKTPVGANDSTSKLWDCEASIVKPLDTKNNVDDIKEKVKKLSKQKHFGVMGDYKKAVKLVKLRLTKSNDPVRSNAVTSVDTSFANVPLSQCASYNIQQNLKSSTMLTTNINLSDKLAQQLKDLSTDSKVNRCRHRKNQAKVTTKQRQIAKSKTESTLIPPVSGSFFDTDETQSHKVAPDESCTLSENNIHSSFGPGSIISRQVGRGHNILEQSYTESQSLPHISVTSFPSKSSLEDNTKGVSEIEEDNDNVFTRGAAVRAETCVSPYLFDKGNPQLLQLKARPLPLPHKVCTSCGGISESQEDEKGGKRRKSTRREKGGKNKGSVKNCCKTYVEGKWKLADKRSHRLKVSSTDFEKRRRTCTHNMSKEKKDITSRPQIMNSPTTTKRKCEEMSINFMNKSIKFRFQCDVSVSDNDQNGDENGDKTCQWLNNLSTPSCKDRYQCPVATETRIYKDSVRRRSSHGKDTTPEAPVTSPYLDYCKIKAEMLARRKEELCKTTEHLSDTCLAKDVYNKAAKKTKRFPVIPMKKNKDSPRTARGQSSSKNKVSSTPNSDFDLCVKSTKPTRLPYMKTIPYNTRISSENKNNRKDEEEGTLRTRKGKKRVKSPTKNVHTYSSRGENEDISTEQFNISTVED